MKPFFEFFTLIWLIKLASSSCNHTQKKPAQPVSKCFSGGRLNVPKIQSHIFNK